MFGVGGRVEYHAPRYSDDGIFGSRPPLFCSVAEPDPDGGWRVRMVAQAVTNSGRPLKMRIPAWPGKEHPADSAGDVVRCESRALAVGVALEMGERCALAWPCHERRKLA